jgi:hypothetical protein
MLVTTVIVIISILVAAGCDILDDEKDETSAPQQDHFKAEGLVLIDSGIRFLHYFRGELDTSGHGVDTLEVPVGLTPHWEVKFLDEDEQEIDPPTDPDKSFGWVIADTALVRLYRHDGQEWEFHLEGHEEGKTTIEFRVMHNDHYDFHTIPIPVRVAHHDEEHGAPVTMRLYDETTHGLFASAPLTGEGDSPDTLFVSAGDDTGELTAKFVDANGVEFQPGVPPHALGFAAGDTTIVSVNEPTGENHFTFSLHGLAEGATTLVVQILHDGAVGKEFAPVTVVVSGSGSE